MFRLFPALLFAASLSACSGSKPTPDPTPPPPGVKGSEPMKPPPPAAPAEETHTGTLKYTPLPPTMSVEAYMGVEYTLESEGGKVVLGASESVNAEALEAMDGKNVTVKCTKEAAAPPEDDNMAHPIDQEGEALPRPQKCLVSSITAN